MEKPSRQYASEAAFGKFNVDSIKAVGCSIHCMRVILIRESALIV